MYNAWNAIENGFIFDVSKFFQVRITMTRNEQMFKRLFLQWQIEFTYGFAVFGYL